MGRKNKSILSKEEKHKLNFMAAERIVEIVEIRRFFIKTMKVKSKEQGYTISKEIIQKINREVEIPLMGTLMNYLFRDKLTVKYVDTNYDRLFFMPNDAGKPPDERKFDEIPLKT